MKRALEITAVALGFWLLPVMSPPPAPLAPYLDLGTIARAVQPDEVLPDPALERRARALSAGLRCLVCQNQSIDDSNAELAKDLRVLVRQRLTAGDSDEEVIDYLVSRYGEFVLLRPRFDWQTALLWGTPIGVLLAGGAFALFASRRNRATDAVPGLSAEEERAVEKLLSERGG